MFAVSKLADHAEVSVREIGKIAICEESTSAVFDLPTAEALKLVKFASAQDLKQFAFSVTDELPQLQV